MDQHSVRIVVGEGPSANSGLLRSVLEREGFDVVGVAATPAELAPVLADAEPDVVVLDDAIGISAVQVTHEIAPRAKVVLVWPGSVVPIGGDARVEPGHVMRRLGPTIVRLVGAPPPRATSFDRPDWIDQARKDPATLRDLLMRRAATPKRPSVTELQRRGQRLHPNTDKAKPLAGAPIAGDAGDEDENRVVILPMSPALRSEVGDVEGAGAVSAIHTVDETPDAEEPPAGVLPPDEDASLNRKIGMLALGGAAIAGALIIALSFGGRRLPSLVTAEPFLPPIVVTGPNGPDTGGQSGGNEEPPANGGTETPPQGPSEGPAPTTPDGAGGTNGGNDQGGGDQGGNDQGGGDTDTGDRGGGNAPPFGNRPSINPGSGGAQPGPPTSPPGTSGDHNPHGGPPGLDPDREIPPGHRLTHPHKR